MNGSTRPTNNNMKQSFKEHNDSKLSAESQEQNDAVIEHCNTDLNNLEGTLELEQNIEAPI